MFKKYLSILVGFLMVFNLAACSGSNASKDVNTNTEKFYYEETALGVDSNWKYINGIQMNSKNQLVIYDEGGTYYETFNPEDKPKFITLDSEGAEVSSFECDISYNDNQYAINHFTLDSMDNIYLLADIIESQEDNSAEKKYFRKLYQYDNSGNLIRKIDFGEQKKSMDFVQSILVDDKENIYIITLSSIKKYDAEGQLIKELDGDGFKSSVMDGEWHMLSLVKGTEGYEMQKNDVQTGEIIWHQSLEATGYTNAIYYSKIDDSVYLIGDEGVSQYTSDGQLIENQLDFSDMSFISDEQYITGFVVDRQKHIYLNIGKYDDEGSKPYELYKYTYTIGEKEPDLRKILSIVTLQRDEALIGLAKKFQQEHPNIKVEVKSMSETSKHMRRAAEITDDDIKKFNSEILSGKSGDIILVDGLPYTKYIEKNMFENLSEWISRDKTFYTAEYFENILDACKYKGNLYTMPVSFYFSTVEVDKALTDKWDIRLNEDIWTWSSFYDAGLKVTEDKNKDGSTDIYGLAKIDASKLLQYIFAGSISQFIDFEKKNAFFDSEEFIRLLEMTKTLSSEKVMHPDINRNAIYMNGSRGTIAFDFVEAMDLSEYSLAKNMLGDQTEILGMPYGQNHLPRAFNAELYAINSHSLLKSEAWEFIKFMISEKAARNVSIKKDIFENYIQEMMKPENQGVLSISNDKGEERTIMLEPVTEDQKEHMIALIQSLGQLNYCDRQIRAIIEEELKSYLNGQKTTQDAARMIQNKVNIYLNE